MLQRTLDASRSRVTLEKYPRASKAKFKFPEGQSRFPKDQSAPPEAKSRLSVDHFVLLIGDPEDHLLFPDISTASPHV